MTVNDLLTHGTYTAYGRYGCRCLLCRTSHNEKVARNRAERLASGRLSHGTVSAWDAGCRCGECRHTKAARDYTDYHTHLDARRDAARARQRRASRRKARS